ncbi:unnamed protein product [Durusdinium trenchii]|uniref:FH2 domain-containing protein n=1 Tax=Durusdinium trenchii TaxID=1381693 RepID=A0ABP0MQD8_9DINO
MARGAARHAIRVAHPSFGEREVALEPGPLQEQLASLCEASGIAYDEDEDLKVLVTDWDVVLGHADDFEALPRRPPYRLVAAVDLAEAQLQGVEASSRKASSKALKVLLQSIHGNESFAQEVIAQAGIPLLLQALAASAPDQLDLETATAAPWELAATAVAELLHYESGAYFCEENAEEVFSEETFTVLMKLAYSGAKACSALLILLLLTQPAATLGCLKTQLKPLLQICAKEESPQEATMLLKVIQDAVQELKAAKEEDLLRDLEEALVPETHDQAQVLEEKLGPRMLQPLVEDLLSASLSSACHQLQRDAFAEQNLSLKAQARQRTQEDLTVERLTEQIRRLDKAMTKMLDFIELENHRPMELWLQDLVRKGFSAMPAWPHGQTPLHYFAQFMEDERLAELLIALGCPLLGCDQQGFTPAQRATQRGRHDLTFLLQAEGPGEASASVLSFIQLSDDDRPEEAQLRALAKKCQGYLHKYPSSGQRFLWTTMQKRYFAIRSNRKAKGGRATLCWELGYWESFEAFEDPDVEPKNSLDLSDVLTVSQAPPADAGVQICYRKDGNKQELLAVAKDSKQIPSSSEAELWCQHLRSFVDFLKETKQEKRRLRPKLPKVDPFADADPGQCMDVGSFLGLTGPMPDLPEPRRSHEPEPPQLGSEKVNKKSMRKTRTGVPSGRRSRVVSHWHEDDSESDSGAEHRASRASARASAALARWPEPQEFRIGSFSAESAAAESRRASIEDMYSFALEKLAVLGQSVRRSLSRSRSWRSAGSRSLSEGAGEVPSAVPSLVEWLEDEGNQRRMPDLDRGSAGSRQALVGGTQLEIDLSPDPDVSSASSKGPKETTSSLREDGRRGNMISASEDLDPVGPLEAEHRVGAALEALAEGASATGPGSKGPAVPGKGGTSAEEAGKADDTPASTAPKAGKGLPKPTKDGDAASEDEGEAATAGEAAAAEDVNASHSSLTGKGPAKGKSKGPPPPTGGQVAAEGPPPPKGGQVATEAGGEAATAEGGAAEDVNAGPSSPAGKGPAKGKSKGPPPPTGGQVATEGGGEAATAEAGAAEDVNAGPRSPAGKGPAKGKSKGPAPPKGGQVATEAGGEAATAEGGAAEDVNAGPRSPAGKGPAKGKNKGPRPPTGGQVATEGGGEAATAEAGAAEDVNAGPSSPTGKGPAKGKSKGPPPPSKSGTSATEEAGKAADDSPTTSPALPAGKGPAKGKSKGPPPPSKGIDSSTPPEPEAGKVGKGPAKGKGPAGKGKGKGKGKEELKLRKPKIKPSQNMKQLWWTRFLLGKHLKEGETIWDLPGEEEIQLQIHVIENRFGRGSTSHPAEEKTTAKKEKETLKAIRIITDPNLIVGKEAALRNLPSAQSVATALSKLDALVLCPSHLAVIKEHACPQPAQVAQLEESIRENPGVPLALPEEYMWQISRIPAYQARVSCWNFLISYKETVTSCGSMFSEFGKIQRAVRKSQMLQKLLALILEVGNYLNGGTERGQADGFDLETLGKLDSVKDNVAQSRDARHLIFEMFFCGAQEFGQLAKEDHLRFYDRGEQLLEELGPLMKSVSRAVQRDSEGTLKMMKNVRVGLEEAEESLRELNQQLTEQLEALQMALELTDDPADPLKLHMAVELSTAKAEIKALEEQGTTCREDYGKLMKFFNHTGMKSSDFILLWDNLLIPEDLMLAIPLSTLKKYIFPRFCAPSVIPNLHDLLLLWGFRAAEQKPPRKSQRVRRKRRDRVPTPATDVMAVVTVHRFGAKWLGAARRKRTLT